MRKIQYATHGTCSRCITITLDDNNVIEDVLFEGGCHGNTQGISALVRGMHADDVIKRLKGIRCKEKPTSCPDQLARALEEVKSEIVKS